MTTTSSGKCNEVKASGDSMCHLPAGHEGQHVDTTHNVPVTWPASKYCNERVWDSGDMTDCGQPLPCWKHSAAHKERIKDLRYLVDFLARQPILAAEATTFTIMFTQVATDDVVAICEAMNTKPRQSPCPSDMWIEKAFGGVELHVVVPKAACGREVTTWEIDERLRGGDPATTEAPEVAAVLTPDAAAVTIERCSDSSCGYCYPAAFWSSPAYRAANGAWFRAGEDGGSVQRIEHGGDPKRRDADAEGRNIDIDGVWPKGRQRGSK